MPHHRDAKTYKSYPPGINETCLFATDKQIKLKLFIFIFNTKTTIPTKTVSHHNYDTIKTITLLDIFAHRSALLGFSCKILDTFTSSVLYIEQCLK